MKQSNTGDGRALACLLAAAVSFILANQITAAVSFILATCCALAIRISTNVVLYLANVARYLDIQGGHKFVVKRGHYDYCLL